MGLHCTVVMPAYNTAVYIGEAIRSVLDQSYQDFDLLVVDDGSVDNTVEIVDRFSCKAARQEKQVSLLSLPSRRGAAGATRIGIEHAQGPVITIVDSDDRITPDSLSMVVPHFKADEKLGFVWTRFACSIGRKGWSAPLPKGKTLWDAMVKKGWWNASHQRFFRKAFYGQSRGLTDAIPDASDLQLVLLMASTGCKTKFIPKVTYWYRMMRPGSISSRRTQQRACHYRLIEWARRGFDDSWLAKVCGEEGKVSA